MSDNVPDYLLGRDQLILTVLFTVLFSLVLLLVSIPFSHNVWFQMGTTQVYLFTLAFFLIAATVLIISRRIMFLRHQDGLPLDFSGYILWIVLEIIIIDLLYTFFTLEGERFKILDLGGMGFGKVFFSALKYIAASIGLPAIVAGMYFALQDKDNTIKLMNMGSVIGDMKPDAEKRITLFDNNSVLKFSVNQNNLYYIESDDNYIKVWYSDGSGEIKQYMLRCRLKTVEDSFKDSDLVRCHRKYIVNISKIDVLERGKDSYMIDLGLEGVDEIPISKTYEEAVLSRFNSR